MQSKIKPCPFCDSEPSITQGLNREKLYKLTCANPNCNVLVYLTDSCKDRLIERWNRRSGHVSEPKWSNEFPKTVGYWWYRKNRDIKPEIVELRCNPENMNWYAVFAFTGERRRIKEMTGGQWADIYFPYKEKEIVNSDDRLTPEREERISLSPQLNY